MTLHVDRPAPRDPNAPPRTYTEQDMRDIRATIDDRIAAEVAAERERCHQIASQVAGAWSTRARTAPTPLFAGMGAAEEIDAKITSGFDPATWLATERL